jgi:hypothetical protein
MMCLSKRLEHYDLYFSLFKPCCFASSYPRLFRPPINSAPIPQSAPALFAGTKGRILDQRNPYVAAHVTDSHLLHSPAHGRDYTYIDL